MTYLPSFVVFHGLVSEYWHYQIQTSVSPLKYRISFFYRIPRTNFKLCEGIFSFDLILCISKDSTWIGIKLIGRINLFMLYISDKFHHQNQKQKSDISHFTLMFKSFHTSCRLHIIHISFPPDSYSVYFNDKAFHTQNIKSLGFCLDMTSI